MPDIPMELDDPTSGDYQEIRRLSESQVQDSVRVKLEKIEIQRRLLRQHYLGILDAIETGRKLTGEYEVMISVLPNPEQFPNPDVFPNPDLYPDPDRIDS